MNTLYKLTCKHPVPTLLAAILLSFLSVLYSIENLELKTKRDDLTDQSYEYHQNWLDYERNFSEFDDLIIIIEGGSDYELIEAIEYAASLVDGDPLFSDLFYKVDESAVKNKELFYASDADLQALNLQISGLGKISNHFTLPRLLSVYRGTRGQDLLAGSMARYIARNEYQSPWDILIPIDHPTETSSNYLLFSDIAFLKVKPANRSKKFNEFSLPVDRLREIAAQVESRYPFLKVGTTGLPVLESDEMRVAQRSNIKTTIISLVGVLVLFIVGFKRLKHPLLVVLTLTFAVTYTFGLATLTLGHLNLLSMFFTVMLIGLGVDYGIHFISTYDNFYKNESSVAIAKTLNKIAPVITWAAVTTSVAFFASYFTPFKGIRELGIIAGFGVPMCLLSVLIILPSLLNITEKQPKQYNSNSKVYFMLQINQEMIFIMILVAMIFCSIGIMNVKYDRNLLNLQPETEAIDLERKVNDKTGYSAWYVISQASSFEECKTLREKFESMPAVGKIEDVLSLVPEGQEEKVETIEQIHKNAKKLSNTSPARFSTSDLADETPDSRAGILLKRAIRGYRDSPEKLRDYQAKLVADLRRKAEKIKTISVPEPILNSDIPDTLKSRFVGKDGTLAMHIHGEKNLWEFEELQEFINQTRYVDPYVVGKPIQFYEASIQMEKSYQTLTLFGLIGVLSVLVLHLRNVAHVFITLIPLIVGGIFTLGVCGWLGIVFNAANIISLPIILGAGIDSGIHIIREFVDKTKIVPSYPIMRGIIYSFSTSIIGFGSLALSYHRGLMTLGTITAIGIFGCFLGTLVMSYLLNRYNLNDKR